MILVGWSWVWGRTWWRCYSFYIVCSLIVCVFLSLSLSLAFCTSFVLKNTNISIVHCWIFVLFRTFWKSIIKFANFSTNCTKPGKFEQGESSNAEYELCVQIGKCWLCWLFVVRSCGVFSGDNVFCMVFLCLKWFLNIGYIFYYISHQ